MTAVTVVAALIGIPTSRASAALSTGGASTRPAAAGYGEAPSATSPAVATPHTASTSTGSPARVGYWTVAADGGVYNFGTVNLGGLRGQALNQPIVAMAANADGQGYRLAASDGGIFTFGDANYLGSKGGEHLNQPIVGMAATPDGQGYWLVASDGGMFTFGDAGFFGSKGGEHLNQPVVGMASTANGAGYWLVASDGGMFSFGNALFFGSEGNHPLNRPVETMAATPDGAGYWLIAADGGVFSFGDAPFLGSTGSNPGPAPIVGMAATAHGGSTGYDISWPQCGSAYPPGAPVDVVGVTNGWIGVYGPANSNYGPNPCLKGEAAWAGSEMQAYQVATPIDGTSGDLTNALNGPKSCPGPVPADTTACGYNWGWNNALQAVSYVHQQGLYPQRWWLDVEINEGWSPTDTTVSAQIIQGMIDAYHSLGLVAGVYCTSYQWGKIAGNYLLPGMPTWIAGAGNVYNGTYSATAFCAQPGFNFAEGNPLQVQYGYAGSGYDGPYSPWDQDYACPTVS